MLIYTVSDNDTWFDISERFDLSIDYLKKLNSIPYDDLPVGTELIIVYPKTVYYAMQGDTLAGIARMYGTTAAALLRNNPYLSRGLETGDRVIIDFEDAKRGILTLNGYCYTFIEPRLYMSILPYLTYVTIFTYGFDTDGTLVRPEPDDEYYVQTALDYGTAPLMHLSTLTRNGNFSSELAAELLSDKGVWDILINNIVTNVEQKGYKGVDMDFEYLPAQYAEAYAEFAGKLRERLNELGYVLITALAPKTSADQQGLLYQGHDYRLLGQNSDMVLLMTYEWGYAYSEPMAVAPIKSVERVVNYAVSEIEPEKILLGLPFYGYDWKLPYVKGETVAQSLSVERAEMLARRYNGIIIFDEETQAPYFYYNDGESEHIVWFESLRGVEAKLGLTDKYTLAGGGIWNIDRPFYRGYMLINVLYDIRKVI
ncbi:MAG: LysM peptidoglycan-binding domain-containing protein [Firmicutes bacterium]|nr:LysM peptidoglycan-binding domain-containing protein [Bacillota bacterium]